DREPDDEPPFGTGQRALSLNEEIEYLWEQLRGYARTGILDPQHCPVAVPCDPDHDPSAIGCVLDSVVQQVDYDLRKASEISVDKELLFRSLHIQNLLSRPRDRLT